MLVASRLLEYELWTRVHSLDLGRSHGEEARELLGQVSLVELVPEVLERALEPFPVRVRTLDALHLATMDHLRQGIHLRAYAQKQPKQEYKREAFELFQDLLYSIKRDVVRVLPRLQFERQESIEEAERRRREEQARRMRFMHQEAPEMNGAEPQSAQAPGPPPKPETFIRQEKKVGRNEQCPCGSGKKYKHCHGKAA